MKHTLQLLVNNLSAAAAVTGRGRVDILREALSLRFHKGGYLGISEYFDLGLFRNDWYGDVDKRDFVGYRLVGRVQNTGRVNANVWKVFGIDKLAFYQVCEKTGVAVPPTLAVYGAGARTTGKLTKLDSAASLQDFLATSRSSRLFVKPIDGVYGSGAHVLEVAEDGASVSVKEAGEQRQLSAAEYSQFLDRMVVGFSGMLFQHCLTPHASLKQLAGNSRSGLRVGMAKTAESTAPYAAVLKINSGTNITDNYKHGSSGNLLASINLDTGRVERVITGYGATVQEVTVHPATQQSLQDFEIPFWPEVVATCCNLMNAFPGIRMAGVDVAITDEGPVIFEINTPGDFDLLQIASRKGVLANPSVRALVKRLEAA